ncbi:MAG TPA: hypothetical protein VL400_26255, partial [Polyangiaceae bacterium]|nr:hypothetical protein [Polyangiaceae bacterium]
MSERALDDADRLVDAALRDHLRVATPARLRQRLERRHLGRRSRWLAPAVAAGIGALAAAAIVIVVMASRPAGAPTIDIAAEAVGDHQRVLIARGLGVEASDMHQV